jgi:DNA-binding transcriptional MerR regulator
MDKSPDAFRTISEVAEDLDLPQHVLRFWETRFGQIRPLKRGGGRRYYRPDDVDLLRGIRHLLYGQGYTIRGVQRIFKEKGLRYVQAVGRGEASAPAPVQEADEVQDATPGFYEAVEAEAADPAGGSEEGREAGPTGPLLDAASRHALEVAFAELAECRRLLMGLADPAGSTEPEAD